MREVTGVQGKVGETGQGAFSLGWTCNLGFEYGSHAHVRCFGRYDVQCSCVDNLPPPHHTSLKIYLFGAHITSYKVNGVEKTWMSTLSCLDGAKPMRGGVPIAFPQFADEGPLALHGFARESIWKVEGGAGEEGVVFVLEDDEKTRKLWQHSFRLEYRVKLNEEGDELDLSLKVVNKGSSPFTFGGCLHTYFAMDAMDTKISGLGGCEFIDKCDSRSVKKQDDEKITIPEEAHRSAKDAGKQEEVRENYRRRATDGGSL